MRNHASSVECAFSAQRMRGRVRLDRFDGSGLRVKRQRNGALICVGQPCERTRLTQESARHQGLKDFQNQSLV
jgi:hypothetical protein